MTAMAGRPFIVIGENIHATRVVLRGGSRVAALPDGRPALPFTDEAASERLLPVPDAALDGPAGRSSGSSTSRRRSSPGWAATPAAADLGRGVRPRDGTPPGRGGRLYLDLNVDEVTTDVDARIAAMRWIVAALEDATDVAAGARLVVGGRAAGGPGRGVPPGGRAAAQLGGARSAGRARLRGRRTAAPSCSRRRARARCRPTRTSGSRTVGRSSTRPSPAAWISARAVRGLARAAGRGRPGGGALLPRRRADAAGLVRGRDPPHRRPLERELRAAGAPAPQRRLHRPRDRRRGGQWHHRPGGERPSTGSAGSIARRGRTGWPADLLTGADPYGGEFLVAFRAGELA